MGAVAISSETERSPSPATADRRWLGLAVIATAQLMIALDATVVNIALPSAQAALGFADADRQWIVTAYTLALGGLLFLGGRIADSVAVGRRRALLIGLIGFAAASALSGAAINLGMLVVARALQGAFAALLAPTALSTLAVMFTGRTERARAFGIYGAIAASGGAIGLLLGGVLTQYLDWRWCLYINVPIAIMAAVAARAVLPDPRPATAPQANAPFDLIGLLLGSGGLLAVVYGCGQAASLRWNAALVEALLGAGVLALGLFVVRESRFENPLLPLGILLDRQRGVAYSSALLAAGGMFGGFLFLTYELQVVLGFTPLQAGLAFLPMSAASFVAGTEVAPRLLTRLSSRMLMTPGFLLAASGMAVLSQLSVGSEYLTSVLPAEILLGLGIASVMMPASNLATSRVTQRNAGIASAALNSAQQVGASLGTAVLNTVAASTTAAFIASSAGSTRAEALVHGYASAAVWAALLLLIGAAVALSISNTPATWQEGSKPMIHVVPPDEGTLGTIRILAGAAPTRGQYFMFESETAPATSGAALDVHGHAAYDESEYVLTGTREIVIEGQRWEAGPGFFGLAPRHAHHGMRTIGATPSRWVHFFSPAGIEAYFVERERLREQGASPEVLRALSAQHGAAQAPFTGDVEDAYVSVATAPAREGRVIVAGRDTRDAYAIVEWSTLPEEVHSHADQEEGFYVISGEITLEAEGETTTATAGSFVLVPRGVAHRHVTTPGSMVLAVYSPGHALPHPTEGVRS